jgi:hypothetical protein
LAGIAIGKARRARRTIGRAIARPLAHALELAQVACQAAT